MLPINLFPLDNSLKKFVLPSKSLNSENQKGKTVERHPTPIFFSASVRILPPLLETLKSYEISVNRNEAISLSEVSSLFRRKLKNQLKTEKQVFKVEVFFDADFDTGLTTKLILKTIETIKQYNLLNVKDKTKDNEFYVAYNDLVNRIKNYNNEQFFNLISLVNLLKIKPLLSNLLDIKIKNRKELFLFATKDLYSDIDQTRILMNEIAKNNLYANQNDSMEQIFDYFHKHPLTDENDFFVENPSDEKELLLVIKKEFTEEIFAFFLHSIDDVRKIKFLLTDGDLFIRKYNILHNFFEALYDLLHIMVRKFEVQKQEDQYKDTLEMIKKVKMGFVKLSCL